jgi:hypothetical protein
MNLGLPGDLKLAFPKLIPIAMPLIQNKEKIKDPN